MQHISLYHLYYKDFCVRKKWIYLEHFQNHTVKFSFLYKNKTVICVFRAKGIQVADMQKPPRGLHHGAVWKRFK